MRRLVVLAMLLFATPVFATVSDSETIRQSFTTNGSTTTFTFTFKCNSSDDVFVYSPEILTGLPKEPLGEDTDYTIAPTDGSYLNGGVVTISPALASTVALRIVRRIKQSQETSSGAINPATVALALDKLTRQVQDAEDRKTRSLHIPESDSIAYDMTIPNAIDRAGKNLGFDDNGNPTVTDSSGTFTSASAIWDDITVKSPWFDVRAYGAIGNGTADDTTALQDALDAANAEGGGIVFLPAGTYLTTSAVTIYTGTIFKGVGFNSKITVDTFRAKIIAADTSATDILIEDLWIYGSGTTGSGAERGFFADSVTRLTIRNVRLENMTIGVQFQSCTGGRILHCFFKDIVGQSATSSEGYGILANSGNDHIITDDCRFKTMARHAIYYSSSITNSIMSHNTIDGTGELALAIYSLSTQDPSKNNIIANNTIKNVSSADDDGHGIGVFVHSFNTLVIGNTLEAINDYGIYIEGGSISDITKTIHKCIVSTNTIVDSTIGVRVINAQDVQVVNNIIDNTSSHGIQITYAGTTASSFSKNILITNNTLMNIGDDGINMPGTFRMQNIIIGPNVMTGITNANLDVASPIYTGFQNYFEHGETDSIVCIDNEVVCINNEVVTY